MKEYFGIGVMSGTSLDGVDVAACLFKKESGRWNYDIIQSKTYSYSDSLYSKLLKSPSFSGLELSMLNIEYGRFIGSLVKQFNAEYSIVPEFIANHGYTVFHTPNQGLTFQIGSGAEIAATTGIKTICDFRTKDVALGGNGAPLVPIGDELLFCQYGACLNLGGFSNISYKEYGKRVAYDICPVNILLNYLSEKIGLKYDANGELGKSGKIIDSLLLDLNELDFYKQLGPKSLGREFLDTHVLPLINSNMDVKNLLRTAYEHISIIISKTLKAINGNVLITGGGVHNSFLIELIRKKSNVDLAIPDLKTIDFKEALIFAFLGVLYLEDEPNCLASVTGAKNDTIGGALYK
ncbi:MAG: anhydro-N-acetylmuramic acid kinase [Salinivirgaceae bacterium]|nr:anhydro-N-acetylmuramic acid kinase [Salinivirgaceae bacterium]